MTLFLLWSDRGADPLAADRTRTEVGRRWRAGLQPLFGSLPEMQLRHTPVASLAFLEIPVAGWRPPSFEEGDEGWALAIDYPLNARRVLESRGVAFDDGNILRALCRELERSPASLLRDLAPPFALVWSSGDGTSVHFQNDGLGQSQVFEYRAGDTWALTNRVTALGALDVELRPIAAEWAVRFTLGWFPMNQTGYEDLRHVPPATAMHLDRDGLSSARHDVLHDWVQPGAMTEDECCDLARSSIQELVRECSRLWECPSVGLSGGWDSRAIAAVLRTEGVLFSARVRGNPGRNDVILASHLASIAGFDIRIKTSSGIPAADPASCRRSITQALRWQAGYMTTLKHKTFLVRKPHLDGGVVNVTGQHGGLGKADFVTKIGAHDLAPEQFEDRLVGSLLADQPTLLAPEHHEAVRETTRDAYRQADRYGLTGLARLHFFYLFEYTRRWSSASLSSQTGLVFAPYLNPEFLRACYAYPAAELTSRPLHRHIVATLAPEWADVPYADRVTPEEIAALPRARIKKRKRREFRRQKDWKRKRSYRKYSHRLYWEDVGPDLFEDLLRGDGFWTEVFDAGAAREGWRKCPDPLAIACLLPDAVALPAEKGP